MTEEWWQDYKKNKKKTQNIVFKETESELKRRFKAEKTPEEMYSMCKTDNNYWKQYRASEKLDDDSVGLVLCKDIGCELMYCQAMSYKSDKEKAKEIDTYGCSEQMNQFRECYVKEKRRFNFQHPNWKLDPQLIPTYLKEKLAEGKDRKVFNPEQKTLQIKEKKLIGVNSSGYI